MLVPKESANSCVLHFLWMGYEGVELVELVSRDVLHHSMQPVLFSCVEVLVVEPEEGVCHTGLEWPWSEVKLTSKQVRKVYILLQLKRKVILIASTCCYC